MKTDKSTFYSAAYGSDGWQQRVQSHEQELGEIWTQCGIANEWQRLRKVILHTPGQELLAASEDPDQMQMLAPLDMGKARDEHHQLIEAYQQHEVEVTLLNPQQTVKPNQMFCADLFAMTPYGAILARPASTVRAGEEREMARCLASLGVPILKTLTGNATFEGADLVWIHRHLALLGQGLRSNREAALQICTVLAEMNTEVVVVDMPFGTMHLMGMLRIVEKDLALAWPRRTPHAAVIALRDAGYRVEFIPEHDDFEHSRAFNIVTLGPRKILMVSGNPKAIEFYQSLGIECIETPATELSKAAGAVGCLTGVVARDTEQLKNESH